jgi:hypothetical protein
MASICPRTIAQLAQVALGCARCSCRCCVVANAIEVVLLLASPFIGRGCLGLWPRVFLSRARGFEAIRVRRAALCADILSRQTSPSTMFK